jgi:mono/diheme cytochrome c family protein
MSAPLKVLVVWSLIAVTLVVVVFYRYDLIAGIKKSFNHNATTEQTMTETAPSPAAATDMAKLETTATPSAKTDVAAASTKTESVSAASLANGKMLYETKTCVLCHGADGKADTPTGKALNSTNLTSAQFHNNKNKLESTAYIINVLENGVPGTGMVSFKSQIPLEQDRKDLANYVTSLASKK